MGELVGIDPRGAHELIRRMEAVKAFVGRTRPGLDAAIAEAGQDWAGRQGTTALHRTWAFLDESQRDLKWRIDTVEQLVPVRERGLLTAAFPFDAEPEARRAAEQTAAALRTALATPDPTGQALDQVLSPAAAQVADPAYAAALLAALGPALFVRALRLLTEAGAGTPGAPQDASGAHSVAGSGARLLTRAFASGERTGRLGDEWRAVAETAPPGVLGALVSLAPQSGTFLNQAALTLLGRPDPPHDVHGLVTAYAANPLAFQQFLAEHPRESATLLAAGDPALQEALDAALEPGVGAEGLRARAWANVRGSSGG
ncbi:unnamed protein product [[Actinomadura] parvosata subsp. kistnae]|uniref:Uncharacterized protein n=1 Tax=[Actinomadura] parvosata subsp. kistnae TaxID=1909395 RepID=A0A1V0A5B9_9ACTN|nr:hypothetical protein [Nonomuraea sp. ATCC 55076]AQZ65415.1 hypothetical protein BKM31_31700 [Nonomuraea sp. ATCC 55076]SPL96747.1 unnamed protein product [Actinomadura parvosata subsp. kistnae]